MDCVRRCRRHDDFRVAREFEDPGRPRAIDDVQAPQLDVVLGGHHDLGVQVDTVVAAAEFRASLGKDRLVVVGACGSRLMGVRPALAGRGLADVAERAPVVARRIFPPSRDGQILPAAAAAAGVGHHHVIVPVRQQLHLRRRRGRRGDDAHRHLRVGDIGTRARELRHMREYIDRLRDALLQQEQRRLELRIGQEALLHRTIAQQIVQRQQAHALVMRHERAHDLARLAARQTRRRVVDRLVKPEATCRAVRSQALQVRARRFRSHHQRQGARVRRDDDILGETALQSQSGHAERPVLIVAIGIDRVVPRFGHAPRHADLLAVRHLQRHRRLAGRIEQRAGIRRHDQQWHQVLEHRAAPGQEDRPLPDAGEQASQRKPALLGDLAGGDGDVGGEAGFGREEVVVTGIACALIDVMADCKQVPSVVVQKAEVHACQRRAALHDACDRGDAPLCLRARERRLGDCAIQRLPFGVRPTRDLRARCLLLQRGHHTGEVPQRAHARQDRQDFRVIRQHPRQPRHKRHRLVERAVALHDQRPAPCAGFARHRRPAGPRGVGGVSDHQVRRARERCKPGLHRAERQRPRAARKVDVAHDCRHTRRNVGCQFLDEYACRIADAGEQPHVEQSIIREPRHARTQCQQVSRQVAAVHRRDVARFERLERLRVVPVEEMSFVPLESLHGAQRAIRAFEQRPCRQVPQVVRRKVCQQRQPHVGRRCPVCNGVRAILLPIVGRQPVGGHDDEPLEVAPGAARQSTQEDHLLRRQPGDAWHQRATQPPRQRRRTDPEQQERRGGDQCPWRRQHHDHGRRERHGRRHPHLGERSDQRRRIASILVLRGRPLEQPSAADEHSPMRTQDCAGDEPRLVGQACHREGDLGAAPSGGVRGCEEVIRKRNATRPLREIHHGCDRGRGDDHTDHHHRPPPRRSQQGPRQHEQHERRNRHEAPAQVVEDLPLRQEGQRIRGTRPRCIGHASQQPACYLPVAANPAPATADIGAVARRVVLVELDVGDQARAGIAPLQQIVAQDAVLRKPPRERALECVDVVDPFANERALAESILIDVGNRARVGVDAGLSAEKARVTRTARPLEAGRHPRLQDAVSAGHALALHVVMRAVQRMRHRAHQLPRRVARQLGIGIERDHVFRAHQRTGIADHGQKPLPRIALAQQQRIEVGELAALALVSHPHALTRIPSARAMQEVENAAGVRRVWSSGRHRVLGVERANGILRRAQQLTVTACRFLRRVGKVGEQRKAQVGVLIGEVAHLERFGQSLDRIDGRQHRRHDDE